MSAPTPEPKAPVAQVRRYLLRNPAIAVTLVYLLVTFIGVTFSYIHFRTFGVSIFDYWQPSDLALAGFREPVSFLYAFAVLLLFLWDSRVQANLPSALARNIERFEHDAQRGGIRGMWAKLMVKRLREELEFVTGERAVFGVQALGAFQRWSRANLWLVHMVLALITYVGIVVVHTGVRHQSAARVFPSATIVLVGDSPTVLGAGRDDEQLLIGASNAYLFLSKRFGGEVTIVPVSSVLSFEVHARTPAEASLEVLPR